MRASTPFIALSFAVLTGCATVDEYRASRNAAKIERRVVPPSGTPKVQVESVFGQGASRRMKGIWTTYYVYPTRHPVYLEVMYGSDERVEKAYLNLRESSINSASNELIDILDDPSKELSILEEIDADFPNRPWNKQVLTSACSPTSDPRGARKFDRSGSGT